MEIHAPTRYQPGELVYCLEDVFNDGGVPDLAEDALLAVAGTRGVVVKAGHLQEMPDLEIYLVRFEGEGELLGPPVGMLADELGQTPVTAHA